MDVKLSSEVKAKRSSTISFVDQKSIFPLTLYKCEWR